MHLQKSRAQPHCWTVSGKPARNGKPAVRIILECVHDPSGNALTLCEIRYFVQPVQQEEEISSLKQPFAKIIRSLQVDSCKLVLNKGVQSLVKVL